MFDKLQGTAPRLKYQIINSPMIQSTKHNMNTNTNMNNEIQTKAINQIAITVNNSIRTQSIKNNNNNNNLLLLDNNISSQKKKKNLQLPRSQHKLSELDIYLNMYRPNKKAINPNYNINNYNTNNINTNTNMMNIDSSNIKGISQKRYGGFSGNKINKNHTFRGNTGDSGNDNLAQTELNGQDQMIFFGQNPHLTIQRRNKNKGSFINNSKTTKNDHRNINEASNRYHLSINNNNKGSHKFAHSQHNVVDQPQQQQQRDQTNKIGTASFAQIISSNHFQPYNSTKTTIQNNNNGVRSNSIRYNKIKKYINKQRTSPILQRHGDHNNNNDNSDSNKNNNNQKSNGNSNNNGNNKLNQNIYENKIRLFSYDKKQKDSEIVIAANKNISGGLKQTDIPNNDNNNISNLQIKTANNFYDIIKHTIPQASIKLTTNKINNNIQTNNNDNIQKQQDNRLIDVNPFDNDHRVSYTHYSQSMKNKRNYNQDRFIVKQLFSPYAKTNNLQGDPGSYMLFGVFDGHGGSACSQFLQKNLVTLIQNSKLLITDPKKCLEQTILKLQEEFIKLCQKRGTLQTSGSTATICLSISHRKQTKLYVANVGDSRICAIGEDSKLKRLTYDHKPQQPEQKKRIIKNGGKLYKEEISSNKNQTYSVNISVASNSDSNTYNNRNNIKIFSQTRILPGSLNVSRTLGDIQVKMKKYGGSPGIVIADPDINQFTIKSTEVSPSKQFDVIILGSDGLFEGLNDEEISAIYSTTKNKLINKQPNQQNKLMNKTKFPSLQNSEVLISTKKIKNDRCDIFCENLTKKLLKNAAEKSYDNITAIVIKVQ